MPVGRLVARIEENMKPNLRLIAILVPIGLAFSLAGAEAQGMLRAPTPPAAKAANDVVGLIIENLAAHPMPASPATFGQAFLPGRGRLVGSG